MFYRFLPLVAFFMQTVLIWALARVWKKRFSYRLLLLYLVSIAIWALFIAGLRFSPSLETAMKWEKAVFPVIPLISLLLFHFCFVFTRETRARGPLVAVYIFNLSAFLLSFTPLVLRDVQLRPYGYAPVVGPLGSLWFASMYIPAVWGMVLLWRYYRTSHVPEERNRTLYLLTGMCFLLAGGMSDWAAAIGVFPYPLGMVGQIILSTLITIAVIRYRLFDIRPYFYSVAAYIIAGGAVVTWYGVAALILFYLLGRNAVFAIAPLGLVLYPATRRLQEPLAALFNRRRIRNIKLLDEFAKEVGNILDLNHLAQRLTGVVATVMITRQVLLYLNNTERKALEPIAFTGGHAQDLPSFPEAGLFASRLKDIDHTLTAEELRSDTVLRFLPDNDREVITHMGGQLFFPLKSQQRLVGMMVLGEKASWETYNAAEIGLLSRVTGQVAVVLDNARLYSDALRNRDKLEAWLNSMNDSVIIVSPDNILQFMNQTAIRKFGNGTGMLCWKSLGVEEHCRLCLARPLGGPKAEPSQYVNKIRNRLYDVSAAPLVNPDGTTSIIEVLRDITEREQAAEERRELERRAQIASRLATVGEMASGIAHEINNPLTGVIGFSQLLLKKDLPTDLKKQVKIINEGAARVAAIVKRLLTFARQQRPERKLVDINTILEATVLLRSYELRTSNINVTTHFNRNLPKTMADGGQLQQVFLNIIINAEKEMKLAHGTGNLVIRTENAGTHVVVSFADDGPGIAEENLDKIFTPFFTTRQVGEGTGLGLSVCWGIVAEHKGRIYVRSEPGQGATFYVELPIVLEAEQPEPTEPVGLPLEKRKSGRVLVVDDDSSVTRLLGELLAADGHRVSTVDNSTDALESISNQAYDLILLDIKLPGISGIELYKHLQNRAPEVIDKVVFITGDVMAADTKLFLGETQAPYLTKPFDTTELTAYVAAFVSRGSGGASAGDNGSEITASTTGGLATT